MKELLVIREAEVDILEIFLYLSEVSGERARRITYDIDDKCHGLCQFPDLGRIRDDLGQNLRSLPVGNYLIVYELTEIRINILHVIHSSRDLNAIFPQED